MNTVSDLTTSCKLTLENGLTGTAYQVERLERRPGEFAKGFRLRGPAGELSFAHELPNGLHECSCRAWTRVNRACEHTQLLTAAGLFDAPVDPWAYDPSDDELVEIDWESDAP